MDFSFRIPRLLDADLVELVKLQCGFLRDMAILDSKPVQDKTRVSISPGLKFSSRHIIYLIRGGQFEKNCWMLKSCIRIQPRLTHTHTNQLCQINPRESKLLKWIGPGHELCCLMPLEFTPTHPHPCLSTCYRFAWVARRWHTWTFNLPFSEVGNTSKIWSIQEVKNQGL